MRDICQSISIISNNLFFHVICFSEKARPIQTTPRVSRHDTHHRNFLEHSRNVPLGVMRFRNVRGTLRNKTRLTEKARLHFWPVCTFPCVCTLSRVYTLCYTQYNTVCKRSIIRDSAIIYTQWDRTNGSVMCVSDPGFESGICSFCFFAFFCIFVFRGYHVLHKTADFFFWVVLIKHKWRTSRSRSFN